MRHCYRVEQLREAGAKRSVAGASDVPAERGGGDIAGAAPPADDGVAGRDPVADAVEGPARVDDAAAGGGGWSRRENRRVCAAALFCALIQIFVCRRVEEGKEEDFEEIYRVISCVFKYQFFL